MGEKRIAKNIAWNTFGSLFYFACQWLLSVAVVRLSDGYSDAGVLSLAMSVTNIFATVALFNVRNFQVSDSDGEYTPSEYSTHRLFTSAFALVLCIGFTLLNGYSTYVTLSIIFYMTVKIIEAYADVLHGMAQNKWRLDIAGRSYVFRGILLILTFSLCMYFTKDLALSISAMSISNLLLLLLYDLRVIKGIEPFGISVRKGKLVSLTVRCLPMLVYGICTNSIVSGARYFIEMYHGTQTLGYYATVSSVAVLVQALVTLIFTPLIGVFNEAHRKGDKASVVKLLVKLTLLLLSITALAFILIFLLGDFAMTLVFGSDIRPYVYLLYPTVLASCITAFMWLMGMLLVVMRDSLTLLIGAVLGITLCIVLSCILIPSEPYLGANIAIIAALSLIALIYLGRFIAYVLSKSHLASEGEDNNE